MQGQTAKREKKKPVESKQPRFDQLGSLLDLWIHETYPNPQRKGCPGRQRLEAVVRATTKVRDKYTLGHIGHCAACLDEMKAIKREIAGV